MKLFLRKILIQLLQPFGFYITYYSSVEKLYNTLKVLPLNIQEFELTRIFDAVSISKKHTYYNNLLAAFIPEWNLNIQNPKFIGFGAGESSLSSFRKVRIGEKFLHEKIYYTSHPDLKRISWFYENAASLVQSAGIVLPKVNAVLSGPAITAIYTDYVELKQLDKTDKEQQLVLFSTKLYEISITNEFKNLSENLDTDIKNFSTHFEYKRNRELARTILADHDLSLDNIEKTIMNGRYVLTHGDIQETNAFNNTILIDWDSVGIFPAGFDPAFLLFYLIIFENNDTYDISNWINKHYKSIVKEEEWQLFQLSFVYFLLVFIQTRLPLEKRENLNKKLIKQIKTFEYLFLK